MWYNSHMKHIRQIVGLLREILATLKEILAAVRARNRLLAEIHEQVVMRLPEDINKAKREIKRSVYTCTRSEAEIGGPRSAVRSEQVKEVKRILLKSCREDRTMTLNDACLEAWAPIKNGYPSAKALYVYCHAHESEF